MEKNSFDQVIAFTDNASLILKSQFSSLNSPATTAVCKADNRVSRFVETLEFSHHKLLGY